MESAENREHSPKTNQPEESNDTDTQSLSKIETIKLLNDSIDRLESTIKEISANSTKTLPSPDSINTLLNTTQELADSVAPTSPPPEKIVEEIPQEVETPKNEAKSISATEAQSEIKSTDSESKSSPKKSSPSANQSKTRNKIVPNRQEEKQGSMVIGGIAIAIIIVAIVWLCLPQIKTLISVSPEINEVVDPADFPNLSPTQKINPNPKSANPPVINLENTISEVAPDNLPPDNPVTDAASETLSDIVIPHDLTSPGRAKNLKILTIEPELTFSPEQTLVAALQSKLAALTENYDSDLFEQVQVDVDEMNLSIAVTDKWYELSEPRQTKLANEILKRSRKLNFSRLEFQDPAGKLVARNPVVGDVVIIIH